MKKSHLFRAVIALVILAAIAILVSKDYYTFKEDLEGKEATILYATCLREETRMDAEHHGYLAVGKSVCLTGNHARVNNPKAARYTDWVEILVDGETYWIQEEAIGEQ